MIAGWYGQAETCEQLQSMVYSEIERGNDMSQHTSSTSEHLVSRRTALAMLATLPDALLRKVQNGFSATVLEDFLPQCAASISACQHLLRGDGIATVEQTLPRYLPILEMVAQYPSRYQQPAASLAAQGCLLAATVVLHRTRIAKSEEYYRQAVLYSHLAAP